MGSDSFKVLAAAPRLCFREQIVEIERPREHRKATLRGPRPLLRRAVPIKLNTVFIRVAEVKCFTDPVIGRAVELDTCPPQALERIGQFRAVWVENRHMKQPRGAARRRRASAALPRVEPDVMMIATGGDEGGLAPVPLH